MDLARFKINYRLYKRFGYCFSTYFKRLLTPTTKLAPAINGYKDGSYYTERAKPSYGQMGFSIKRLTTITSSSANPTLHAV